MRETLRREVCEVMRERIAWTRHGLCMYGSLTIKERWKTNGVQEILVIGNEGKRLIVFHICSEHDFFMGN